MPEPVRLGADVLAVLVAAGVGLAVGGLVLRASFAFDVGTWTRAAWTVWRRRRENRRVARRAA